MRAQLARHARRALIQHSRAPSCAAHASPRRCRQLSKPVTPRTFQRTFLEGLFKKAPREIKQPDFEPGWMNIMVWRSRMLDNLRPPPRKELVSAWKSFFRAKRDSKVPLNSTQAMQCHRLFDYLLEPNDVSGESDMTSPDTMLDFKDALFALKILRTLPSRERSEYHLDFVKTLYAAVSANKLLGNVPAPLGKWVHYIETLTLYGGSKAALGMIYKDWATVVSLKDGNGLVNGVAKGLAREGHEEDLVKLVEHSNKNGVPYEKNVQLCITSFFAERNRIPETQHWFAKDTASRIRLPFTYRVIASFAARNGLQDWAAPFFLELGESKPGKLYWDILLQAILLVGRGLDVVETMMSHMTTPTETVKADTATINGLLDVAVEQKNPVLAEEILAIATDRQLKLDGETYLILMDLRLEARYFPGVQAALKKVTYSEPWQAHPKLWLYYVSLINKYIAALCAEKRPDFQLIKELTELAEEEAISLFPETLASLCPKLLEMEQYYEVMDVLSVHAFQYSATERGVAQDALVKFTLDPGTSTSRAWSSYQILRQFFQDLSHDHRVRLMHSFLQRKRPDMASHVFGHMRQHRNSTYHPKLQDYIACFEGLGQYPDEESLEMVYNMLKMDTGVQPNTQLYNALILAHAACGKSLQALDFWNQITASREGPTYASLEAIFWALEKMANGAGMARKIWQRIVKMDVDIPPAAFNAYVGAIAGSGEEQEARNIITSMKSVVGTDPDAMTLGIAHNALPGQELQSNFRNWAKMRYPDPWAELEKKGKRMTADSLCMFKLNRILKA